MQQLTHLLVTKTAYQDLQKLDTKTRRRLKDRIADFMIMDNPLLYTVKLSDPKIGTYRWRIGDYRLIFDIDKHRIVLLRVQHRKDLYK